eukprot:CAMPEP_0198269284 /NCGR_PEP_ID=MMETSP1447-20131203/40752_1 /TAXON_ID=420782 /ORGANISM="Chaetoceros dichaeta, Strain CCMP1751" /LENGTH=75 /DNA_ID=CAMNT_0043960817 /DNA_START=319 /DNA_END=542 /DNA_ORIENTATION=+
MGLEIKIRIVGRKKSASSLPWLEDAYQTYSTRLRPSPLTVETIWHKNDGELLKNIEGDVDKGHSVVLLDPKGRKG